MGDEMGRSNKEREITRDKNFSFGKERRAI